MIARGEPVVWLTAGALAIALFMIVGLIALVVMTGGSTFWPKRLHRIELLDGRVLLGELTDTEAYEFSRDRLDALPEEVRGAAVNALGDQSAVEAHRTQLRVDNKQLTGESYVWIDDFLRKPNGTSLPEWALTIERTSWGRFLGLPEAFVVNHRRLPSGTERQLDQLIAFLEEHASRADDTGQQAIAKGVEKLREERSAVREKGTAEFLQTIRADKASAERAAVLETGDEIPLAQVRASQPIVAVRAMSPGSQETWSRFEKVHPEVLDRVAAIHDLDRSGLGRLSEGQEEARMDVVRAALDSEHALAPLAQQLAELDAVVDDLESAAETRDQLAAAFTRRFGGDSDVVHAVREIVAELGADSAAQRAPLQSEIEALVAPLSEDEKAAVDRYRKVVAEARRQTVEISADIEALRAENEQYVLRAVTADGQSQDIPVAEIVRGFPANRLGFAERLKVYLSRWAEFLLAEPREANTEGGVFPAIWGTVAMTLIMTIAVVPFGVLAALFLREYAKAGVVVSAVRIAVNNLAGVPSIVWGVFGLGFFCYVVGAGIDEAFYPAYVSENKPVFGTGGLMWASLTLALLTLPVVIVATEEALSAVPNSMREGSYACGASKWQTIRRIVLPRALPGIMTGMILAMARGAGEVAPLMLVGA
ncbi:MAG: phosphate ABC transporter permease PstA, partial [Planctomycetota bacterium]|nr:phosphate ABC transporter permease PstA [Planctomycetota bacterium]